MTGDRLRLGWFKSSYSDSSEGDDCVEVADATSAGAIHVRDSKDARLPHLTVTPHAWAEFVAHASGR
ncbi:DUF397 domain-containing protein [Streptomyces sp. H27-S2]|uniref:DUF397 domain-containing protein n=1 Tax=Streptomyces antarcticus TaxID=2996458 RepID=UPI00226E112A|nr:DUF397 domain-containing protein [Streptomyces sp. H27-S2]MCY0953534.1 DUF397 domain-containing protein [Streptomyces sp. H27-S2]